MSTQNWIKRSDREPTMDDLPIWLYNENPSDGIRAWFWSNTIVLPQTASHKFTHWMRGAADIPAPPKEETQVNKDTKAYVEKYGCACPSMVLNGATCYTSDIWHAALAYERAEVLKLVNATSDHASFNYRQIIALIQARCGGAK